MPSQPTEPDVVAAQNPWWEGGPVPQAHPYRRSMMRATLLALATDEPRRYQVIIGPRRVGKTVSMYQMVADLLAEGVPARSVTWLRLDHPELIPVSLGALAKTALDRKSRETEKAYLFLDEVLYADRWDLWLKTFYDEGWPLRVVATGSATAALRHARRESGVGRWEERFLSPLLFHDVLAMQGVTARDAGGGGNGGGAALDLLDDPWSVEPALGPPALKQALMAYLLVGGFPELATVLKPEPEHVLRSQRVLKDDAVDRALYKDLRHAYAIDEPLALEKLLYVLAGQVGGLLATRSIAPAAGISHPTTERYLKYLEEASLVFLLPNSAATEEAVARRGRKIYLGDPALRNAVLLRGLLPLSNPAEIGTLLENAVAVHLHALARNLHIRLYHWRRGRDEVDFVLDHPERPVAVEVTYAARHSPAALRRLAEATPKLRGRCWLVGPGEIDTKPQEDGPVLGRVPPERWLHACGRAADRAALGP